MEADRKKSEVSPCISTNFEWPTFSNMNILYMRTQTLCHRIEKKINQKFVWLKVASINISRSTVSDSLSRGDVTSSNNNESAIFRQWKSNLKWRMFHRLNDKGDNSLTEIPGCPEKRIAPPFSWCHFYLILNEIKVSLNRNGLLFKKVTFKIINEYHRIQ